MNPLAPNLAELNDEQLTERMTKILKRMTFASRTGNSQLYMQLNTLYQEMVFEQRERIIRKQRELIEKGETDPFDGLIDVNKKL